MQTHRLESLAKLEQMFPKNWALIALADSHKPTAPLLQMRMGTPKKSKNGILQSNLLRSLSSGAGGLQMLYTSRTRGNSDNLLSNSSTLLSALSSRVRGESAIDLDCLEEEFKSEDEMRRVVSCSSEGEESDDELPPHMRSGKKRASKHGTGRKKTESSRKRRQEAAAAGGRDDDSDISDGVDSEDEDREPFLEPEANCSEHNLKIHSWHKRTKKLLCTYCI